MSEDTKNEVEIMRKRVRELEGLKDHLKARFCGIDAQIDMTVEFMRPWYLMPELQRRPTVISLWGLTGTGKTALTKAIAEFLQKDPIYFDMGEFSDKNRSNYVRTFAQSMANFSSYERQAPIVVLDDIHKVRTLDPMGNDVDRPSVSSVWDFVSEGSIYDDAGNAEYLMQDLENLIESDDALASSYWHVVRASLTLLGVNGIEEKDEYREKFRENPKRVAEEILGRMKTAKIQTELDFSNSLIFLTGNLDELFGMSEVFSADPDLTPDDLHDWSLGLTVPRAKESLLRLFRPEQVARLGSNHVIYPAFSSEGLMAVIEMGLQTNAKMIFDSKGVSLVFDDSVRDIVYREGVFPTQGARPLISTLDRLLQSSLPDALMAADKRGLKMIEMGFDAAASRATFRACPAGDCPNFVEVPVSLVVDPLRRPIYDGEKATIAVHEAGHVVSTLVETGRPPLRVSVFSTHSSSSGFSQRGGLRDSLLSASEILSDIAIRLSGAEAERMVFGDGNQTWGSGADIENATDMAKKYVLTAGLSDETLAARSYSPDNGQMMARKEQEVAVEGILVEARVRAAQNVRDHPELLARLAAELLVNKYIGPTEVRRVAEECGFEFPEEQSRTGMYERFVGQYGISAPSEDVED